MAKPFSEEMKQGWKEIISKQLAAFAAHSLMLILPQADACGYMLYAAFRGSFSALDLLIRKINKAPESNSFEKSFSTMELSPSKLFRIFIGC